MNRGEIRERILNALNESATSPVFWSTSEMDSIIDEAQEIICEELEAVKRTDFLPLGAGQLYYFTESIPNCMAPYRLYTTHNNQRIYATTVSELDKKNELWARVNGDPIRWAPVGWDMFVLYPHPAAGGGTLRVDYLGWPRALQDDSDEPEIPSPTHDGLVLYGVQDGLLKRWDAKRAAEIFQLFLQHFTKDKARNMGRMQSRTWQASAQGILSGDTWRQ